MPGCDQLVHPVQPPPGHRDGQGVHTVVVAVAGGDEPAVEVAGHLGLRAQHKVPEEIGPFHQLVVVGDQRAALPAADQLGGAQAEGGHVCQAACPAAVVGRAEGERGVLHDLQAVCPRDLHDRVHLDRVAELVGDDDGPGARGDAPAYVFGVDVARVGFAVREDRHGPEREQRGHRGQEGVRRRDHLVPRLETDPEERGVQGVGPGVHGDAVPPSEEGGKFRFQLPQFAIAAVVGGGAAPFQVVGDDLAVLGREGA